MRGARNIKPMIVMAMLMVVLGLDPAQAHLPDGQGGMNLYDATQGSLLIRTDRPNRFIAAPILKTDVRMTVTGMIARTTVRQRFTNASGEWVEGVYVFPMPDMAAVDHLRMRIGDRIVEGQIQERAEARRTYQQARDSGRHQVKPWPWADTWPVARMVAPRHGADLIILAGGSGRTLAFGPAHIAGTALPGESGTTVLSAHRDTHFRFLARLAVGDEIVIYRAQASTVRYRVRSSEVVDARIARIVHDDAHSTLILVTCYPFNSVIPGGPSRYVVTADLAAQ